MEECQILVAEDDPSAELLLQCAFTASAPDIRIQYTPDGKAAIDYLQAKPPFDRSSLQPPALLLLDLKMPRMDGFEVLKWLQEHPPLRPKTIAVFTASSEESDRTSAAALGADLFFVKPLDFHELCNMTAAFAQYARTGSWPPAAITGTELRTHL